MTFSEKEISKIRGMYVIARQFKNIVEIDELVPTPKNDFRNKIYPFIVNKSFSCEVYLKLILMATQKKKKKGHNLKELSQMINIDTKFKNYLLSNKLELTNKEFDEYLNNISNAFEDWRYIYEKEDIKIMHGFLNTFCNFLDEYCKELMKDLFNIDVDKELKYI